MKKLDNDKIALIVFLSIIICGFLIVFAVNKIDDKKVEKNNGTNTTTSENKNKVDYAEAAKKQMAEPNEGDQIAIFHIKDYGDIKVKFFSDVAPKAVENFVTHAKEGYYNGVTFHRVINEFMIQGGDPEGTGMGGESIWGSGFGEEFSNSIVPYRGALCMASKGTGTKSLGSQFFIVQANYKESMVSTLKSKGYTEDLINEYKNYGGDLYDLYKKYTVFGQVISGMDVVDKIATTKTDASDKPLTNVVIDNIEVTTYTK